MKTMFRERNPLPLGLVTVLGVATLIAGVLRVNDIVSEFGRTYQVEFAEAAGVMQGDPVIVSGLEVGRVKSVELGDPGHGVLVTLALTNGAVELGSHTRATIGVETILGDKSVELESRGSGQLSEGATIPLTRTTSPYDVQELLTDLTDESIQIDVKQLAKSLEVVAETLDEAAPEVESAFTGVSRLSATIRSRDAELRELLDHADSFSAVLADRNKDLTRIVKDGNLLFKVLADRRDAIRQLLVNVTQMARELRMLVKDNEKSLQPTLAALNRVLVTLRNNEKNLDAVLRGVAIYATSLGEAVSSGEFFSGYVANLPPTNFVPPVIDLSKFGITAPAVVGADGAKAGN